MATPGSRTLRLPFQGPAVQVSSSSPARGTAGRALPAARQPPPLGRDSRVSPVPAQPRHSPGNRGAGSGSPDRRPALLEGGRERGAGGWTERASGWGRRRCGCEERSRGRKLSAGSRARRGDKVLWAAPHPRAGKGAMGGGLPAPAGAAKCLSVVRPCPPLRVPARPRDGLWVWVGVWV